MFLTKLKTNYVGKQITLVTEKKTYIVKQTKVNGSYGLPDTRC